MIDTKTGIWKVNTGPSSTIAHANTLHKFDPGLSQALLEFLENQVDIVDFGCGNADYSKILLENGKQVDCFDGNPNTPEMTGGIGKVLDLSEEFNLEKKYECVISLEVGEHIPKEKEQIFLDHLDRHCEQCIILSWALPGQGGDGHFNEEPNKYIINEMEKRNYKHWEESSNYFRNSVNLWWFKKTIMVFLKQ
jgi:hypothetical protein